MIKAVNCCDSEFTIKSIDTLTPNDKNSRTHDRKQIDQISASIKEFGFTNPILVDDNNGIIAGHGRVLAAKQLGLKEVPALTLKNLTREQIQAYIIADNQLALNAGWDFETLKTELEGLKELDFDVDLLGFDDLFLQELFGTASEIDFPKLSSGEKEPFQQMTFNLHDEQAAIVTDAITLARTNPLSDTGLNENSNGNALSLICQEWLESNGVS